jgi:hypothetical protein
VRKLSEEKEIKGSHKRERFGDGSEFQNGHILGIKAILKKEVPETNLSQLSIVRFRSIDSIDRSTEFGHWIDFSALVPRLEALESIRGRFAMLL